MGNRITLEVVHNKKHIHRGNRKDRSPVGRPKASIAHDLMHAIALISRMPLLTFDHVLIKEKHI